MRAPIALLDQGDTVDVVWGSSPDTSQSSNSTDVWFARFDGAKWTAPEHVFHAPTLEWERSWVAAKRIGAEIWITVGASVSSMSTAESHSGVAVLRRARGRWNVSWVNTGAYFGDRTALLAQHGERAVLAFAGAVFEPNSRSILNSIFVSLSADGGASWSEPREIYHYAPARVTALELFRAADGAVHMVWALDSTDAGGHGGSLGHAVSTDAGRAWNKSASIALTPALEFSRGVDLRDAVALLGRDPAAERLYLVTVTTRDAPRVQAAPYGHAEISPTLGFVNQDSLLLIWGTMRAGAYPQYPAYRVPLSMSAVLKRDCHQPPGSR